MTETTIPSFSHAAQQAQQWVNELAEELDWNKQREVYKVWAAKPSAYRQ